jgi:hypothetical protein
LFAGGVARAADPQPLADRLAGARPGSTVTLPAGVFAGGVTLPPGVSLRGAGLGQTFIDSSGADVGLTVAGGSGATVSDLTIRSARGTDLLVKAAHGITVSRVRTTGSITGLVFTAVDGGRIENVVSDANRYGIVAGGGKDNVVVNCTVADDSSLGLSFPSGSHTVAFNNCVAHCATGVYVGAIAAHLHLDHNLYAAMYIGKMEGQVGRKMMGEWSALDGQDKHSVDLPVSFRDAANGDFHVTDTLSWAPDRTVTRGWGAAEFAGANAPEKDAAGEARTSAPCIGALEDHAAALTPAVGSFVVKSADVITSAGLFTKTGREAAYLFHDLPLARGEYKFWLPTRDFEGKPIPAGAYDLRTVESALDWQYLGMVGNDGLETPVGATAAVGTAKVAFDDAGQLITACDGWAENFVNMRAYDAVAGTWHWAFHAPADVKGLAAGEDGCIYALRLTGKQERLTRVDARSGKVKPWPGLDTGEIYLHTGAQATGLAELDGRLYFTDTAAGKIYAGPVDKPSFASVASVSGAASPAADRKNHLLWVIAEGKRVVALTPEGKVAAEASPVAAPGALAARDGRLAVASLATGKVHLFDGSDPKSLKPLTTVGTGDGPFGPFAPDRFAFQSTPGHPGHAPALALGPTGELAVAHGNRLSVFDSSGKGLWHTFGIFGTGGVANASDPGRLFEMEGNWSYRLDGKAGTWKPDGLWRQPVLPRESLYRGDFSIGGKSFGVYTIANPKYGPNQGLLIVRLDNYAQVPVLAIQHDPDRRVFVSRKDVNHDGRIDEADGSGEVFFKEGELFYSNTVAAPNGDVLSIDSLSDNHGIKVLHCAGLDGDGVPIYRITDRRVVTLPKGRPLVSPYTFKPEPACAIVGVTLAADGGFTTLLHLPSAPPPGLFNGAGTDLAGLDESGAVRWVRPFGAVQGLYNVRTVGDVSLTGVGTTAALVAFDRDGLGLGTFNQPAAAHYNGYWLDHAQAVYAWKGDDGVTYAMIADNYNGCDRWWRLNPASPLVHFASPVTISNSSADALAALPAPDLKQTAERPATATVRIPRLAAPMPIDGDLEKWRKAGINPNIIITPETAVTGINGPTDASAVIRMAYQGSDLYVQILRFDDIVTFHQPLERHYMQDCIEMCLNGFGKGFKFDITRTTDHGDIIVRQRFFDNKLERLLSADRAPRVIKVLDDAGGVPERAAIESVYGEDLSHCKVIVTEFKLPIDPQTYQGATDSLFEVAPGKSFWLGFMIDDNDEPGTDVQRLMVWPATYGTFNPPEDGARAVFGD